MKLWRRDQRVDLLVASGFEAGGHRPSFLKPDEESLMGTFGLVPQIAHKVRVPVSAAGGIADGRGIVAALTLGAMRLKSVPHSAMNHAQAPLHRKLLFGDDAKCTGFLRVHRTACARRL